MAKDDVGGGNRDQEALKNSVYIKKSRSAWLAALDEVKDAVARFSKDGKVRQWCL